MPNVTLQDAFRYIMIGFAILGYQYYWDTTGTKVIVEKLTIVGAIIVSLSVGTLIYILYRSLIYNTIINRVQDLFRTKRGTPNYRTYFKSEFELKGDEPRQLYNFIIQKHLSKKIESYQSYFAGIHYAYMVGIIGAVYGIASLVIDGKESLFWSYLSFSCLILLGGFLADRRAETDEYLLLKSLGEQEIENAKKELFGK